MSLKLKQSFFRLIRKQTKTTLKLKLNDKRLNTTNSVKHLSIENDENLNWHQQIKNAAAKLNRANAMLSKVKHFVDKNSLKSIYHVIIE